MSASTETESARLLLQVIPRTMRVIRAELRSAAKSEFSVPQFRILIHLSESPCNNRQLAEIQGVSVAAMSRMVDGLVERGFIQRSENSQDRRQVQLGLTELGRTTLSRVTVAVQRSMTARLSKLSVHPRKSLLSGLSALEELFP